MDIVLPKDADYDADRVISNARFNYYPSVIYYCRDAGDVAEALAMARAQGLPVRVRSGGHQHEGMCSGNRVAIIDLSLINHIRFEDDDNSVWMGPGAKLADVYTAVLGRNRLFPGGGCGDVRVAGLVQGGGWGLYARQLGLTCDVLTAFRMILADGQPVKVTSSRDDPRQNLFWAVSGGGGGNFGIATDFQFKLAPYNGVITSFTVSWSDPGIVGDFIVDWTSNFHDADPRLTTFGRLTAVGSGDPPALVSGYFLGDEPELKSILPRLLPKTWARANPPQYSRVHEAGAAPLEGRRVFHHPEYQPGPPTLTDSSEGVPGGLSSTCDGTPYPHKVSSTYPRADIGSGLLTTIVGQLRRSTPETNARRYLSLHSLGGAVGSTGDRSCFAFREKPFLLQYQAWWLHPNDKPLGDRCMAWVRDFREAMDLWTEGSFINFPDRDLASSTDTEDGKVALMRYYYARNLEPLMHIKRIYDPNNFFDFPMSIPREKD